MSRKAGCDNVAIITQIQHGKFMNRTAIIAGASGLVGRAIVAELQHRGGWNIIGLGRRPQSLPGMRWIAVDLADAADTRMKLASCTDATHVFYAGRYDHPEGVPESVEINTAMLVNLMNALEPVAKLRHVHAVHGSKYYGHQLGPVAVPMVESQPRAANLNFYFNQEDFLIARTRNAAWSYSTSRPHAFCDPAIDHPRSIGLVIAVYAAIQRELGLPLDFPGTEQGFHTLTQFTDLALLARSVTWMATEPRCANQSFNVVNGDYPRWSELWPEFAAAFGMKTGTPQNIRLENWVKDKAAVWESVVRKHSLRETDVHEIALWPYGDYQLRPQWDVTSSMAKAHALGFHDAVDSRRMFNAQFENYRKHGVIP
jgi:nucleoside-diphosphate-sugar epimerase